MATIDVTYIAYAIIAATMALIIVPLATIPRKLSFVAMVASTVLLAIILILAAYAMISGIDVTVLGIFHLYPFSEFFIGLFAFALALVNMLSYEYYPNFTRFELFFSFAIIGMFVVAMANSLLTILLGLELMTLPTAFMIMTSGRHHIEAAVKLFILSAIAIGALSFALALIFPYSPELGLTQIAPNTTFTGNYLISLAIILVGAAMGFEVAAFPFNLWVPDVYQGAPGNVTALLAGINKKVAFVALMEIFFVVFLQFQPIFSPVLVLLSIATMFYGNVVALVQTNVKRLFAYSSISQAGYILIGLAVATQFGIEASIVQIVAHLFMIIGAFAIVLWLESKNLRTLDDYTGLSSRNKFAAFALAILMLSMAGVPPLLGFIGKFLVFSSAIDTQSLLYLAVFGIVNSFISIYYYARLIDRMYGGQKKELLFMGNYTYAVVIVALAATILLGIYPNLLISAASLASKTLLAL
jgi:NADH-quinone oxidoreductase subunit N